MDAVPVDLPRVHLSAAEVCLARTPTVIETVLGSCVAVVLFNPRFRMGAMCHGALPRCPECFIRESDVRRGLRYVDFAIEHLVERFARLGIMPSELVVKLFGGADMLKVFSARAVATVGQQNCTVALETLARLGMAPVRSDLGGRQGRVVYFRTDTGEVLLRRLPRSGLSTEGVATPGLFVGESMV
ncbi:MAG TPA: chemotaxis protein CheD [Bryobacteraceae bacterium]|nr:chemotaxis protein CheD [Bryobacteraceae bacterium]